jgi:hypothetical protein
MTRDCRIDRNGTTVIALDEDLPSLFVETPGVGSISAGDKRECALADSSTGEEILCPEGGSCRVLGLLARDRLLSIGISTMRGILDTSKRPARMIQIMRSHCSVRVYLSVIHRIF